MTIETILNSDMSVAYITDCATSPVWFGEVFTFFQAADSYQAVVNLYSSPGALSSIPG